VIVLTMPVYNEADGIQEFVNELDRALPPGVLLQVVDDASSDSTLARLESVDLPLGRLRILRNSANVGHGPTTLRGLREALINDVDVVASIDGDGQFDAADVAGLLERLNEEWDVL
jgi:glycosyltransferase involved in cell wall biosynthesis